MAVKFYQSENQVPLEMHKVRVIQKLSLLPVEERLKKIQQAGNNTFLLENEDIYLDMLTDSGVNAMSDLQMAASMQADDSYAGSATFKRVKAAIKEVFGTDNVLPAHQGRACENILAERFVKHLGIGIGKTWSNCPNELPLYHHQSARYPHGWHRRRIGGR